MTRLRSLTARLVGATVLVALVVALVAAASAWPVVRDVAEDQARTELARQATALAASPRLRQQLERRERVLVGAGSTRAAFVDQRGRVRGEAGVQVPAGVVEDVLAGRAVSRSVGSDDGTVLVEARPTRSGGGVVVQLPLDAVDAASRALLLRLLLALAVGLAVATAVGVVLARRLARPLTGTAGAARRLAAGERGVPVARTGLAEVDDLAGALHSLDEALGRSEARQREFLLSVSHEMRTPLTAVQGYADALADGLVTAGDVRAAGRTLGAETRRLDRFVADLLLLARLEADDFVLEPRGVDVVALVHESGRAWDAEATRAGVRLVVAGSPAPPVRLDPMRVRQLVDGLVENALRSTPRGGTVRVQVEPGDEVVRLVVTDDGPGLDAADLDVALDRGALHRRHRDRRPVGTGLGLSIAARLAFRMGGALRPEPAERGARFVVEVPRRPEL